MSANKFISWVFWSAMAFTLVMATIPHPPALPGSPSDKIQHVLAFATLSVLGTLAMPRLSFARLSLALLLFGIMIEVVQAIPALNRDSSVQDLIADAAAILIVGLATRAILRWRSH